MVSSSPGPARGRVPGTVRPVPPSQNAGARLAQVRGATYPPLTAPPSRGPIGSPAASSASGAAADQASAGGPSEANALSARSSGGNGGSTPAPTRESIEQSRLVKFEAMLSADVVDLRQLRTLSWSGVPAKCRATSWQLLLGYVPSNEEWRESTLSRKRREYCESVPTYFDVPDAERTEQQRRTLNQILLDVPRTSTSSPMFQNAVVRRSLERVLYIWSVRHPASGYAAASRAAPATAPGLDPLHRAQIRAGHQRPGDAILPGLPAGAPAARLVARRPQPRRAGRGDRALRPRAGRGRLLLVPLEAPRLDTGPLHIRAAGDTADGLQAQGAGREDRRQAARPPQRAGRTLHTGAPAPPRSRPLAVPAHPSPIRASSRSAG